MLSFLGMAAEQWKVFETSFKSTKTCENPFMDVQVDVVFEKDGTEWKQPAFWDGGKTWEVRFAAPEKGTYTYRAVATDTSNKRDPNRGLEVYSVLRRWTQGTLQPEERYRRNEKPGPEHA